MAQFTSTTPSMRAAVKGYMEGYCDAVGERVGMVTDSTEWDAAEKAMEKFGVTFDTAMDCYRGDN
jgi:hypothetical protein